MLIAEEQIAHIARLARLKLSPDEPAKYSRELTRIIDYFDQLSAIDTDGIEPAPRFGSFQTLREDTIRPSLSVEEALKNAPENKDNFFIVPRVM